MNSNELFDCAVESVESIFKSQEPLGAVVQYDEHDDVVHRTLWITSHWSKCMVACYNNIEHDTVQVNIHIYASKKDTLEGTLAVSVCEAMYNGSYFSFTSNTSVSAPIEIYTAAHNYITYIVTHIDDALRRHIKFMEEHHDSDS